MKKHLSIIVAIMALLGITSCNSGKKENAEDNSTFETPKCLVLYYSQTGATKTVAEELQTKLGADIEEIELVNPYTGDYDQTIERCKQERESGTFPAIKPLKSNIADYDVVFVGYPVWFGTYALPIAGLVDKYDFAGKKVVTFCTFGSGGLESSSADLKEALPKAEVVCGYGVRSERLGNMAEEVNRFLIENGFIQGEVEELPDYSQLQAVTPEDTTIFNAACSGYKFPLGTPTRVGKRTTSKSMDYVFEAVATNPVNNETDTVTIYVTAGKEEGAKPVFTRVVR